MRSHHLFLSLLLCGSLCSTAFGQFKLTIKFSQMDANLGQRLEIRVYDETTGFEVGFAKVPEITDPAFDVQLFVLVGGKSYRVDFYADVNDNGQYDPPPFDDAWRLHVTDVQGDVTMPFARSTDFTDIAWPGPFSLSVLDGMFRGVWKNETFSTTDSIQMNIAVDLENKQANASFTSKGLFGNPQTETLTFSGPVTQDGDTANVVADAPWSGDLMFANGHLSGAVTLQSAGLTSNLEGTFGVAQAVVRYRITLLDGTDFATGYAVVVKDNVIVPNRVPGPFVRLSPQEGAAVDPQSTLLSWTSSHDADGDPVTYDVSLTFDGTDTTFSLSDTSMTVDFLSFGLLDGSYTANWSVTATDGQHTIQASNGAGSFTFDIATAVSQETPAQIPEEFALSQNFPNPFNPTTTIEFALPQQAHVTLKVFDLLGREIATLVDARLRPGFHRTVLSGEGLSSGVYLYRIHAQPVTDGVPPFSTTRKFVLLK